MYFKCASPGNNAQFKNKLCYTEDNILVYNLFIAYKDKKKINIKEYFSRYGEVLLIDLKSRKCRNYNFISGYVHFKKAKSAAIALMYKYFCSNPGIAIKPAESWLQPSILQWEDSEIPSSSKKRKENDEIDENLILKLNDDCLIHIFSLLSLMEQLNLAMLCQRFRNIFFEIYLKKYKSLHIFNSADKCLTPMEMRQLLLQFGEHIEEVFIYKTSPHLEFDHFRFLSHITCYCINLRRFTVFSISNVNLITYKNLSKNLKHLKKLDIISCGINDLVCKFLSRLPLLESLNVSGNSKLKGKYLSNFPKLIHLNLDRCTGIKVEYLSEVFKKGQLKSLNIRDCPQFVKQNFEEIALTLNDLTNLDIGTSYATTDFFHIAELRNLTRLSICSDHKVFINDKLFEILATVKGNTLEELVLNFIEINKVKMDCICSMKGLKNLGLFKIVLDDDFLQKIADLPNLINLSLSCSVVTQNGIGSLFERSNTLENIDISKCKNINADILYYICEKIKESKRSVPCKLYVFKTEISKDIIKDKKYLECAALLSIIFEESELTVKFTNVVNEHYCSSFRHIRHMIDEFIIMFKPSAITL